MKVVGSTDTYGRKYLDRGFDRLDRLHYLNKEKGDTLKKRVAHLEEVVQEILALRTKRK